MLGANERINVACIGIRGQGGFHIKKFFELKPQGVDVVALCDVDEKVLGNRTAEVTKQRKKKPEAYTDIRKLLENKSVDAVSIATPNHWHALATIWSCQAGKDVYVEKPASWCIREGRKMVEAAGNHKRIVAVGTHHRSSPGNREAAAKLRAGIIGDVYMSRTLVHRRRDSIDFKPVTDPPKHVHFDLWLGPAPKQPFHENLVHYNWHWFWDFGNGEIGNNGIHVLDLARWTLNQDVPVKACSMGGRFGYKDQAQTPNTQLATLTYPDGTLLVCEIRNRFTNSEGGSTLYFGTEGYMIGGTPTFGYGGKAYGGADEAAVKLKPIEGAGQDNPYVNFIGAMRTRRHEDLNTDVLGGHKSAICFHLANISYRLGGRTLEFDPKTETFVGDNAKAANSFLSRDYRKGFEIPDKV